MSDLPSFPYTADIYRTGPSVPPRSSEQPWPTRQTMGPPLRTTSSAWMPQYEPYSQDYYSYSDQDMYDRRSQPYPLSYPTDSYMAEMPHVWPTDTFQEHGIPPLTTPNYSWDRPVRRHYQFKEGDTVFVDPLDRNAPFWWPAMIVPKEEVELPRALSLNECVVRYFEDGQFSIVSKDDIVPFNPALEPFIGFLKRYPRLKQELSISRALRYFQLGQLPREWVWKIMPSRQASFMNQPDIPNQNIIPTPPSQTSMESIPEKPIKRKEPISRPKRQKPEIIPNKPVKITSKFVPLKQVENAELVVVNVRKDIGEQEIILSDMHSTYLRLSRLLRQLNRQKRDTERIKILDEISAALKSAQTLRKRHYPLSH